jgi:hypothetical protein
LRAALLIAALLAVRLPFLLKSDAFFEADEAVQGLMALHVWNGEFPVFMWNQGYKGVPEVYLTAPALKLAGPEPWVLKAVTLAIFTLFVVALYRLTERIHSRQAALAASAIAIVGPPSLVYWSLAGTAEIAITLLLGTLLLHTVSISPPRTRHFVTGGLLVGAMLWVHLYVAYYLGPLVVWWLAGKERTAATTHDRVSTVVTIALGMGALVYAALWLNALAGGSQLALGPIQISARTPRKLLPIGLALAGLAVIVWRAGIPRGAAARPAVAAAIGFLIGFAPALVHAAARGLALPVREANPSGLRSFLPEAIGIFAGADAPDTWSSGIPGAFYVPALLLLVAFIALRAAVPPSAAARRVVPVLRLMLVCSPILFVFGASGGDAQSYRYLMPLYGALPIALALGAAAVGQRSRTAAAALLVSVLVVSALAQIRWYRRLEVTSERKDVIAALERAGVTGGYAEYWEAYPLTFLSGERLVVVPTSGVRYLPHAEFVRQLRTTAHIQRRDGRLTYSIGR